MASGILSSDGPLWSHQSQSCLRKEAQVPQTGGLSNLHDTNLSPQFHLPLEVGMHQTFTPMAVASHCSGNLYFSPGEAREEDYAARLTAHGHFETRCGEQQRLSVVGISLMGWQMGRHN